MSKQRLPGGDRVAVPAFFGLWIRGSCDILGERDCAYDAAGNPTEYKGNELKWTRMRQLVQYGDSNFFEYGADGIRCKKNDITYALNGSRILKENRGTVSLTYYYGLSGVIGFQYDAEDYFYQKNLQGDITAIYNSYGALVAEYKYDAWGKVLAVVNHTSENIGDLNPFRYRSYYYDTETDLYYLQTRYYDPETGRFINADDLAYLGADESLSSYNLYAYCSDNPVNNVDSSGNLAISLVVMLFVGAAVNATISFAGGVIAEIAEQRLDPTDEFDWGDVLISTGIGAFEGALTVLFPGAAPYISAGASVLDTAIDGMRDGNGLGEIVLDAIFSGTIGLFAGSGGNDLLKGQNMVENAIKSFGKAFGRGIHPQIKKTARKAVVRGIKYIAKEMIGSIGSGLMESFAYGGIEEFCSWYTQEIINRSFRR